MFKALMTALYSIPAERMAEAKDWYSRAFNIKPYFEEPFYIGFNIAGYELGLLPKETGEAMEQTTGSMPVWGVENIAQTHKALLALGATELEAPSDVGGDIVVSRLKDPFGNFLGLIQNPHFPNTNA